MNYNRICKCYVGFLDFDCIIYIYICVLKIEMLMWNIFYCSISLRIVREIYFVGDIMYQIYFLPEYIFEDILTEDDLSHQSITIYTYL